MSITMAEILHDERAAQHTLGLDKATRDALGAYARLRWPTNGAKMAAREWDLSLDEGRGLLAGRASQATVDKILKHKNGGWGVALPVLGAVIGSPVSDFFRAQMKTAAMEARRAVEHQELARAAYRRLEGNPADLSEDRRSWEGSGTLGAEAPRRVAG